MVRWRKDFKEYQDRQKNAAVNANVGTVTEGVETMQVATAPPVRARTPPADHLLTEADEFLDKLGDE